MAQKSQSTWGSDSTNARMAVSLVGLVIVLCGCLLIGITAYLGRSSNSSQIAQERKRLENALNQGIADVLDQQRSIAWWDEAVANIAVRFNEEFVRSEFGIFLTETYRHDLIILLDGRDRPIFNFASGVQGMGERVREVLAQVAPVIRMLRNRDRGGLRNRPDSFAARLDGYQELSGMKATASWDGAILQIDGKPSIVSAITISPNVDAGLLKGDPYVLVSVVGIDQRFLDTISRDLLLPDLRLEANPQVSGLHVSIPFVADDGTTLGYLKWKSAAPGEPVLTTVLPLVSVLVLAIGAFSIVVLRRLSRASHELQIRAETAQRDALLDVLSNMPNRHAFTLEAEAILSEMRTDHHAKVTIAYLDIDRFKDINDTLGHQKGDRLISAFAGRLRSHLSENDFLARIGGDEFAIIRVDRSDGAARNLETTVACAVSSPIDIDGQDIRVTVSLGLATMPEHGRTIDVLMRHADIALYEAKRQGRDRAVIFTEAMGQQFQERRDIELALAQAEALEQFELFFQPIACERSGVVKGGEVLLRWSHPTKGMVPPSVFIPIAEEAGLMPSIGDWVLRNAVEQAGRWPHMDLAINLSPIQFRHSDLIAILLGLTAEHGVDPGRLTLEITEGLLLDSTPQTRSTLSELIKAGFKVALDDFGTGFSSLNYLTTYRFDKLKIDQCFVRNIDTKPSSQAIVQSVIQMSHALGMEVVAEGVETASEREVLQGYGCDYIQGYLVARPLPAAGFVGFVASHNASRNRGSATMTQGHVSRKA